MKKKISKFPDKKTERIFQESRKELKRAWKTAFPGKRVPSAHALWQNADMHYEKAVLAKKSISKNLYAIMLYNIAREFYEDSHKKSLESIDVEDRDAYYVLIKERDALLEKARHIFLEARQEGSTQASIPASRMAYDIKMEQEINAYHHDWRIGPRKFSGLFHE